MERILENTAAATVVIPPIPTTDGELLMQYARHGDQAAFAQLVQKHGRLVWTVCWQVLRQHHEIEDAFQSTFFILAKRARTIRSCDSLCGWLYRVAYRTALRARITAVRKPLLELVADDLESLDDKLQTIEQHEQRAVLLEELHSLPDQYQQALVLCYLEGKSRRAIAEELGCSLEAIKGRLARGKQVLRHRLIRRGVSLSLAMSAMIVPAKAATLAVTPKLVGLTATSAAAWAAGAAAVAKISTTISSQVFHLAHQGTAAMTISSFAKPVVLGIALLGAVSGTLAVDSSEDSASGNAGQTIDLQAAANADGDNSTIIEDDAVEVVMATADSEKSDTLKEEKLGIALADGKLVEAEIAPPSAPQPVKKMHITPVTDVLVQTLARIPEPPIVEPFNIRVPDPMSLKFQIKLAELEKNVSELQLDSKKLEIASFDVEGKERENLLEESRKKLMEAEAEKLKIQIEQQREQIKALEEVIKQQAEGLGDREKHTIEARMVHDAELAQMQSMKLKSEAGKIVAKVAEQARAAAEQTKEAAMAQADQARMVAKQAQAEATAQAAEAVKKAKAAGDRYAPDGQSGALSLQPGDHIRIEVAGAFPDRPIDDVYTIEPMGTVALGVGYGRVEIKSLSVIEAEKAIVDHLQGILSDVQVQVTFAGRPVYSSPLPGWKDYPADPQPASKR